MNAGRKKATGRSITRRQFAKQSVAAGAATGFPMVVPSTVFGAYDKAVA
jgi:hypothetical protein